MRLISTPYVECIFVSRYYIISGPTKTPLAYKVNFLIHQDPLQGQLHNVSNAVILLALIQTSTPTLCSHTLCKASTPVLHTGRLRSQWQGESEAGLPRLLATATAPTAAEAVVVAQARQTSHLTSCLAQLPHTVSHELEPAVSGMFLAE